MQAYRQTHNTISYLFLLRKSGLEVLNEYSMRNIFESSSYLQNISCEKYQQIIIVYYCLL